MNKKSVKETNTATNLANDFNLADLNKVWQKFIDSREDKGKELMLLKEPYALEGTKVILKLSNDVLKYAFNNIKADLQGFLRENLQNYKLVLEAVVEEIENEDMIYTNKEKFAHLAKKHPALKELQEKLGLDPDY